MHLSPFISGTAQSRHFHDANFMGKLYPDV